MLIFIGGELQLTGKKSTFSQVHAWNFALAEVVAERHRMGKAFQEERDIIRKQDPNWLEIWKYRVSLKSFLSILRNLYSL